jgi:hypothetical protein
LGCDDIGVTEVGKATRCALLWAFEPSTVALDKFWNTLGLVTHSYPIGYATYMISDIRTAFSTTSLAIFTRDIEIGKYFGRPGTGTTTMTLEGSQVYVEKIAPVSDKIAMFIYILFAVWFIWWATTRTL